MEYYKCPNCGANIPLTARYSVIVCEYCGTEITLEKKVFNKLAHAERVLEQKAINEKIEHLEQIGESRYEECMRFWKLHLYLWLAAIVICYVFDSRVPLEYQGFLSGVASYLLMFGLIFVIAGKPRKFLYMDFDYAGNQQKFFERDRKWRIALLIWYLVVGILAAMAFRQTFQGIIGRTCIGIFLIGIPIFIINRPSKLSEQRSKRGGRYRKK